MIGFYAAGAMGSGVPLWTPADLPSPPEIWLDWDSSVSLTGSLVDQWNDRSGGGRHYVGSGSSRLTETTGTPASVRVLRASSLPHRMAATGSLDVVRNAAGVWMLVVTKRESVLASDNNAAFLPGPIADGATLLALRTTDGSSNHLARFRRLGSDSAVAIAGPNDSAWHINVIAADYGSGVATYAVDGTPSTAVVSTGSTANSSSLYQPGIGAWPTSNSSGDFMIAAKLVGRGALASADRERLEGWAAWKLGLVGSLPGGHPYKSAPPET